MMHIQHTDAMDYSLGCEGQLLCQVHRQSADSLSYDQDSAFSTQECAHSLSMLCDRDCQPQEQDCGAWREAGCKSHGTKLNRQDIDSYDYDATCTSRSTDLPCKQPFWHSDSTAQCYVQQAQCDDCADLDQDYTHNQQRQDLQKSHRAAQQRDELLTMIRNERCLEQELAPRSCCFDKNDPASDNATPQMRMIVTSWLSEVASEFNMQQETLFLAVALLDRFMDILTGVPRGAVQLVAVACMLLASKQDEVVHPSVEELTDIAANSFQKQDLLRMERILLDNLSWRVKTPTAYTFLHLYTQATAAIRAAGVGNPEKDTQHCQQQPWNSSSMDGDVSRNSSASPLEGTVVAKAAYLTELALLDHICLKFLPSTVAASALLLAQTWSQQGMAAHEMTCISGYQLCDLQPCMSRLLHLHECAANCGSCQSLAPFTFIKEKYSHDCWLGASLLAVANCPVPVLEVGVAEAAAGWTDAGPQDRTYIPDAVHADSMGNQQIDSMLPPMEVGSDLLTPWQH